MTDQPKDGGPAFPTPEMPQWNWPGSTGMSLRDWFAGQALAGGLGNPHTPDQLCGLGFKGSKEMMAEWAYAHADAMLAERDKNSDAAP